MQLTSRWSLFIQADLNLALSKIEYCFGLSTEQPLFLGDSWFIEGMFRDT